MTPEKANDVTLEQLLTEYERLSKEATPGPWSQEWLYGALRHINKNVDWDGFYFGPEDIGAPGKDDASFIAFSRNNAEGLTRMVREVVATNERLVGYLAGALDSLERSIEKDHEGFRTYDGVDCDLLGLLREALSQGDVE